MRSFDIFPEHVSFTDHFIVSDAPFLLARVETNSLLSHPAGTVEGDINQPVAISTGPYT